MLKLYKNINDKLQYWEVWENDENSSIIHWGVIGEQGDTKILDSKYPEGNKIQQEIEEKIREGYQEIDVDDHSTLLVEYKVEGMGTTEDISKRHALEDKLNERLGWTGLGHCDGGSIGSGTMEACCFVVDFNMAKRIIQANLINTEFGDYDRIFEEEN